MAKMITVKRKGYTRTDGTRVKGTTYKTKDLGNPGKTSRGAKGGKHASKRKWITRPGKLGGAGYFSKPAATRHRLLAKCVKGYGYRSCMGSLVVLNTKELRESFRKKLMADKEWLKKTYGAGSKNAAKGKMGALGRPDTFTGKAWKPAWDDDFRAGFASASRAKKYQSPKAAYNRYGKKKHGTTWIEGYNAYLDLKFYAPYPTAAARYAKSLGLSVAKRKTTKRAAKGKMGGFDGDSDVYFSQQVRPLITKAAMTKKLKPLGLEPRGKGSLDRKRHQVALLIDRTSGRGGPLQIFLNGSHYTKGDGDWDISMKHMKGWSDQEVDSFSGDPKKDASAMIQGIYDMMERTLDYEGNGKMGASKTPKKTAKGKMGAGAAKGKMGAKAKYQELPRYGGPKKARAMRKRVPKGIEIWGKRWFQKSYGNTYHTVAIYFNGEKVWETPKSEYGYGDHYVQTAEEWLRHNGYLPKGQPGWQYLRDQKGVKYRTHATDVRRERDLGGYGMGSGQRPAQGKMGAAKTPKKTTRKRKTTKRAAKGKMGGWPPPGGDDDAKAHDLILYADNTYELYQQAQAIAANQTKRWKKGTWNEEMAAKGWMYLMDAAAKDYHRASGKRGKWHQSFPIAVRRIAAAQKAAEFADEMRFDDKGKMGSGHAAKGKMGSPWGAEKPITLIFSSKEKATAFKKAHQRKVRGKFSVRKTKGWNTYSVVFTPFAYSDSVELMKHYAPESSHYKDIARDVAAESGALVAGSMWAGKGRAAKGKMRALTGAGRSGDPWYPGDPPVPWLAELVEMEAESAGIEGEVEVTPAVEAEFGRYSVALEASLIKCLSLPPDGLLGSGQHVYRFSPRGQLNAEADDLAYMLMEDDAEYAVLMGLMGHGVGIWDGRWDHWEAMGLDLKKLQACLERDLSRFADYTGGGSLNDAIRDAAYETGVANGSMGAGKRRKRAPRRTASKRRAVGSRSRRAARGQMGADWHEVARRELAKAEELKKSDIVIARDFPFGDGVEMESEAGPGFSGDREWVVFKNYEDAEEAATEYVTEKLESEPESFAPNWLKYYVTISPTDIRLIALDEANSLREDLENDVLREQYDDVLEIAERHGSEVPERYEELQDEIDDLEMEDEPVPPGHDQKIAKAKAAQAALMEQAIDDIESGIVEETSQNIQRDALGWYEDTWGELDMSELPNFFSIDVARAATDAINTDGVAHFLYSTGVMDLPSGAVAYGRN